MDVIGFDEAVHGLALIAAEAGVELTRMKAAKLLYLAEWDFVNEFDERATDIDWQWLNFGPFDNTWFDVEKRLAAAGLLQISVGQAGPYQTASIRYTSGRLRTQNSPFWDVLRSTVARLGLLTAEALKRNSYDTAPMRAAQATHQGVRLNLFTRVYIDTPMTHNETMDTRGMHLAERPKTLGAIAVDAEDSETGLSLKSIKLTPTRRAAITRALATGIKFTPRSA